jgi:hypothetical protein
MVAWRNYSNTSVADSLVVTGGGNLSTGATSISAGSGAPVGYPTPPFILNLEPTTANQELVLVGSGAGTVASPWIISRGADGTTPKTHVSGTAIAHTLSAGDLTTAATHYAYGSGSGVHGLPAGAWLSGGFTSIATTTTTASQAAFTWSAIPGTYKNLLITGQGRLGESPVYSDDVSITFNGDAGSYYSYMTVIAANPAGVMSSWAPGTGYASGQGPLFRFMASGFGGAANSGGGIAFIPNYAGTTFNKNWYSLSGGGDGTSSFMDVRVRCGVYAPPAQAAITSISIIPPSGNFNLGCVFSLYGLG